MILDKYRIASIAEVLTRTNAVPLPGGHGVYFKRLRAAYPTMAAVPDTVRRCYLCVALLGDSETSESWNAAAWLPHAAAWFDVHAPELADGLDAPRWRYLLEGMFKVFTDWASVSDEHLRFMADIVVCERAARIRLGALHRRKGAGSKVCAVGLAPPGTPHERRSSQWDVVADELRGKNSARLQMMYFMHTLHSSLGMSHQSMDTPHAARRSFYGRLAVILGKAGLSKCRLCAACQRIGEALRTTAMLNGSGKRSVHTGLLAARLPACFRPPHHYSRPPHRAMIERWLAEAPAPRDLLLEAHDVAEAMADLLIDPLRANRPDVDSFAPSDYGYLLTRVIDGPRLYEAAVLSEALDLTDPASRLDEPDQPVPMPLSFAKRLAGGRLLDQVRQRLDVVEKAPRWTARANAERCAICHTETLMEGRAP